MNMLFLKMGIATLIDKAKNDVDPYDAVEFIFDNIPPGQIKEFLLKPESLEMAMSLHAEASKYKEWFSDLIEHIKAQFNMPSKFDDLYDDAGETKETPEPAPVGVDGFSLDDFPTSPPPSSNDLREQFGDHLILDENAPIIDSNTGDNSDTQSGDVES